MQLDLWVAMRKRTLPSAAPVPSTPTPAHVASMLVRSLYVISLLHPVSTQSPPQLTLLPLLGVSIEGAVLAERKGANRKVCSHLVIIINFITPSRRCMARKSERQPSWPASTSSRPRLALCKRPTLYSFEHPPCRSCSMCRYFALEKATGGRAGQAMHAAANAMQSFHGTSTLLCQLC